jgi:nonribosomal peptide synthetase DhbF
VRWLRNGQLEFLGRIDEQIKIRGFRIEPAEIEVALLALGARAAAVAAVQRGGETLLLASLVAPATASTDWLAILRAALRERLPAAMQPTLWQTVDTLPLTPNGKVDRQALSAQPWASAASVAGPGPLPQPGTETWLAGCWAELLGIDAGGIHARANFLDLGGHSLLLTRLAHAIRQNLGMQPGLAALFDAPDLRAMAALIDLQSAPPPPTHDAEVLEW